jgi:hypothetical protein
MPSFCWSPSRSRLPERGTTIVSVNGILLLAEKI